MKTRTVLTHLFRFFLITFVSFAAFMVFSSLFSFNLPAIAAEEQSSGLLSVCLSWWRSIH